MLDTIVRMIDRFLKSIFVPYKSKLLSIQRGIIKLPQKLIYILTSFTKKILKKKPSSKKDYFKIRRHFVQKRLVILVICLLLALCLSALKLYQNLNKKSLPVISIGNNDSFTGDGRVYHKNGKLKYEGSLKDGLFSGKGSLYYEDGGLYYKGNFDRNDFSGKGQTYYKNGNIKYEGDFLNGEYNGLGKLYNENSVLTYQGNFVNGCYDGQGKLFDNEGNLLYEGKFSSNEFNGQGKLFGKGKGVIYQGNFQNGGYSGKGILYDGNSNKIYEGNLDNGKYSGEGIESYPDQSIKYKGSFQNGYYNGNGTLFNKDGSKIYEGTFKDGLYNQTGKLYTTSGKLSYEGEFINGKPEGTGTLYDDNSNVIYKGYFRDGKVHYPGLLGLSQDELKAALGNPEQIIVSTDSSMTVDYRAYKMSFELNNIEIIKQTPQQSEQGEPAANGQQTEQQTSPQNEKKPNDSGSKIFKVVKIRLYEDPETFINKEFIPDSYGNPSEERNVRIDDTNMSLKEYINGDFMFSFYYDVKKSKLNYIEVSRVNSNTANGV